MKKRFLTIAIAAGLAASSFTANAGDATLYGRLHISLDQIERAGATIKQGDELDFSDRKSALGVKGSEDLGDGMKAFYKLEFSVNPAGEGSIGTRDRYVGLKGGMGTVKFGTVTTNYKKTSAQIDPFWHTAAMGQSLNMASTLAGSNGSAGGRMTNALQYHSPKMGGMQMIVNTSLDGSGDKNTGIGFRFGNKQLKAFVDYMKIENNDTSKTYNVGENALKVGATYKMGATKIGFQHEMAEDLTNYDYTMLSVTQKLNDNDSILFSYGQREHATTATSDSNAMALGYKHNLSKRTSLYAAVVDRSADTASDSVSGTTGLLNGNVDVTGFTLGMRLTF